jgi:hypothetical protein
MHSAVSSTAHKRAAAPALTLRLHAADEVRHRSQHAPRGLLSRHQVFVLEVDEEAGAGVGAAALQQQPAAGKAPGRLTLHIRHFACTGAGRRWGTARARAFLSHQSADRPPPAAACRP